MSLAIEHNGRELKFREDDETWSCWDMKMSSKSLRALKAKLDKFDSQARRVSAPVLVVSKYDGKVERADIVMIAKPKDWENDYNAPSDGISRTRPKKPAVWVSKAQGNQTKRDKVALENCVEPTSDNLAAVARAVAKFAEARRLTEEAKGIINGLPRLSIEELTARSVIEDNVDEEA